MKQTFCDRRWLLAILLFVGSSGCEQVTSEFAFQSETSNLMSAGQDAVKGSVRQRFGNPQQPSIPFYFPVDRGGMKFVVESFDPAQPNQLILEPFEGEDVPSGVLVEFLLDPEDAFEAAMDAVEEERENPLAKLNGMTTVAYDAGQRMLTLSAPLPELDLIEPGLEICVSSNQNLVRAGQLYNRHCLHCHGVTGDGNGPTAPFMEPKPRDYRDGVFKFTSTGPQDKISTADLMHLLQEGIPGTYMPSFNMLDEAELALIVDYVKFLAIRGEAEKDLRVEVGVDFAQSILDEELEDAESAEERGQINEKMNSDLQEFVELDYPEIELGVLLDLADDWTAADEEDAVLLPGVPRPHPYAKSLANPELTSLENGRLLYLGKDAQCASCHGDKGLGNGYQTFQFQKKQDGSFYDDVGLHDAWGNPLPPRNLTVGNYRGGRRPIDVFRRIYAGIKGTPMPVFGGKGLTDDQIWDIVNYVLSMSAKTTAAEFSAIQTTRQNTPLELTEVEK